MVKSSPVWEFFKILTTDETKAVCNICGPDIIISRGGKTAKTFTTTALINHLKSKHPKENGKYEEMVKSKKLVIQTGSSSSGTKRKFEDASSQMTLLEAFDKKKVWDINDKRAVAINYRIGEMIAVDNQPFLMVEDVGFRRLVNLLEPKYNVPSRRYFSDVVIPDIYTRTRSVIQALVSDVKSISLTSDIWTCDNTNESFLSLSGHWLTDDFVHKSAVLNCCHFPGSHTTEAIKTTFDELFATWNIDKTKGVHVLIHDNGANMVSGAREVGIPHESCFIHTLQLVITDSLFSQRSISDIIAKCRRLVGHFNHSPLACSKLKKIQIDLGLPQHVLFQDVKTRWNSTYIMLARLHEQKRAIGAYSLEHDVPNLSQYHWGLMENVIRVLQPFDELTRLASLNEASMAMVIPSVCSLLRFLGKEHKDSGVQTMKREMADSLKGRFATVESKKMFILASVLDPRYKTAFLNNTTSDDAKQMLLQEMKQHMSDDPDQEAPEGSYTGDSESTSATTSLNLEIHDLWECFSEITSAAHSAQQRSNPETETGNSAYQRLVCQVDEYLKCELLPRQDSPLLWWKEHKEIYPDLATLAQQFLSAPASSVYSERMFSEAGQIYNEERNRLLPRNAEKLLFLNYNLPLLKFSY